MNTAVDSGNREEVLKLNFTSKYLSKKRFEKVKSKFQVDTDLLCHVCTQSEGRMC